MRHIALVALGCLISGAQAAAQDISAESCSIVTVGDNNRTTLICGDITFTVDLTFSEFQNALEARTAELRSEILRLREQLDREIARGQNNEQTVVALTRELTEKQDALTTAREKQANITASYEQALIDNANLQQELERLRNIHPGVDPARFDEALAALQEGDIETADRLLQDLQRQGEAQLQALAEIRYQRGLIAEQRIDYPAARDHFVAAAYFVSNRPSYLLKASQASRRAGAVYEAVTYAERLFALVRDASDTSPLIKAQASLVLGEAYAAVGRYPQAEERLQDAVALFEIHAGPEARNTLRARHALAMLFGSLGSYAQAEFLAETTLRIRERVLGRSHSETLASVSTLAELNYVRGRYQETEELCRRALEGQKPALGVDHPDTLRTLNLLAKTLRAQGRYSEAEVLHREALEARERVLGPEHPETVVSLTNLGVLLIAAGRYANAELVLQRALDASDRHLGPEHPDTLTTANHLAKLFQLQGRYGEAEPLYRQALDARERILGPNHPETLTSVDNLAGLYVALGRYGEAEPLYRHALEAREKVLGPDHPDTLNSINHLALLYQSQGRYGEAEPVFRRVVEASERILGPAHPQNHHSCQSSGAPVSGAGPVWGGGATLSTRCGKQRTGARSRASRHPEKCPQSS